MWVWLSLAQHTIWPTAQDWCTGTSIKKNWIDFSLARSELKNRWTLLSVFVSRYIIRSYLAIFARERSRIAASSINHRPRPDHYGWRSLQIAVPSLPNSNNTIMNAAATGGGVGGVDLAAIAITNAVEDVHKWTNGAAAGLVSTSGRKARANRGHKNTHEEHNNQSGCTQGVQGVEKYKIQAIIFSRQGRYCRGNNQSKSNKTINRTRWETNNWTIAVGVGRRSCITNNTISRGGDVCWFVVLYCFH